MSNASSMSHGALATKLKQVYDNAVAAYTAQVEAASTMSTYEAATATESVEVTLDAETLEELNEAAARLSTLDMGQQMSAAMNLNYTDAQLAAMTDTQVGRLLANQSTSLLMATDEDGGTIDLSAYGDGSLIHRLAKEAAKRLEAQYSKQIGEEALDAFVRARAEAVTPYRPV